MKHYECPVGDWSCPYFDSGDCLMVEDGDDPLVECDDAYALDPRVITTITVETGANAPVADGPTSSA